MRNHADLAAFMTAVVVVFVVLIPLVFLGTLILKEATGLYQELAEDRGELILILENLVDQLRSILSLPDNFGFDVNQYARQGLGFFTSSLGAIFSSFAKMFGGTFVFLIALYFLLKDGKRLKDFFVALYRESSWRFPR